MVWIRNPVWDCVWILSGIPLSLILLGLSGVVPAALLTFWIVVVLQQSHNLAPMVVAWKHRGFRVYMLTHRVKFVVVPLCILSGSVLTGWLSEMIYPNFFPFHGTKIDIDTLHLGGWQSPLGIMLGIYFLWNTWHFARQNFGILSIYRVKSGSGHRAVDLIFALSVHITVSLIGIVMMIGIGPIYLADFCVVITLIGAIVMLSLETKFSPRVVFILTDISRLSLISISGLWGFAISGINHWLAAIGLSSHVYGNSRNQSPMLFSIGLVFAGTAVFWLMFVALPFSGIHSTNAASFPWWIRATVPAVSLRLGFGFVHFLYDRWLWHFSEPAVRAAIGIDLFRTGHHYG